MVERRLVVICRGYRLQFEINGGEACLGKRLTQPLLGVCVVLLSLRTNELHGSAYHCVFDLDAELLLGFLAKIAQDTRD